MVSLNPVDRPPERHTCAYAASGHAGRVSASLRRQDQESRRSWRWGVAEAVPIQIIRGDEKSGNRWREATYYHASRQRR